MKHGLDRQGALDRGVRVDSRSASTGALIGGSPSGDGGLVEPEGGFCRKLGINQAKILGWENAYGSLRMEEIGKLRQLRQLGLGFLDDPRMGECHEGRLGARLPPWITFLLIMTLDMRR